MSFGIAYGYIITHQYIFLSLTVSEENDSAENTAATCVELQRELIRQEIETTPQNPPYIDQGHATVTHEMCLYCRCSPCVLFSETLSARLRAFGLPRMTNHTKRKGDYRSFYTILNRRGLWRDPIYIARKEALWKMFGRSCQFVLWKMSGNGGQILMECPTVVTVVHKTSITLICEHLPPYPKHS